MREEEEEEEGEGFWLQLVSECRDLSKLPQGRRLLVLGDDDAEKAQLVDRLDGGAPCRGNGLAYRHLSVKDEYREDRARLGVWLLDGDPFYRPLLRYALDAGSLADTTALVVASMSRPWDILDDVRSWTRVLREHIAGLVPAEELERRKAAVLERYREYVEPGLSLYGSLAADNTREIEENLGLELIVVVTRTERMRDLRSEWGYEEEHFDLLQVALREFCLRHGAALFYVSAREDRNCDLLLKYVLHRTHGLPFRLPGLLAERDAVLVPAGWDTRTKIRFATEALSAPPYGDAAFRPEGPVDRAAPEVFAEDDQDFLYAVQSALERPGPELPDARECCSSTTATVVQRNVARRMARGGSPQKKRAAVEGGGDTTLHHFFHSLLNRRTGGDRRERTEATPDRQQTLPEYFLSSPVCSPDSSSLDLEEPFSPPLGRVDPPLGVERPDTLLASRSEDGNKECKELNSLKGTRSTDEATRSSGGGTKRTDEETELTNGESTKGKERTDEETELTNGETTKSEETRSKEYVDRRTRSKERSDADGDRDVGRSDGLNLLTTHSHSETRVLRHALSTNPRL